MGVYIKNMKAPVTCSYCPLIGYDPNIEWNDGGRETQGAYICVLTHELIDNTKREDHCPLVPVPPHGRLIDADALVERIEGIWDCNDMVFRPNDKICKIPEDCKGCKWAQTKDCIQRMVENAPTIIQAEPA